MKKLLLGFFVTVLLFACNNNADVKTESTDSTAAPSEAAAAADTTAVKDSTNSGIKATADSVKPNAVKFDDIKRKKDSVAR